MYMRVHFLQQVNAGAMSLISEIFRKFAVNFSNKSRIVSQVVAGWSSLVHRSKIRWKIRRDVQREC